jgi:TPR repeat protein
LAFPAISPCTQDDNAFIGTTVSDAGSSSRREKTALDRRAKADRAQVEKEAILSARARGLTAVIALAFALATPIGAGPTADPRDKRTNSIAALEHGDYVTALSAIKPLAEEGDAFAQLVLGVMYFNGWNTPQDYVQARKWFNLAWSRSPPGADHDVALLGCNLAAARMTPAQIDEAQKLTQDWFSGLSQSGRR